MGLSTGPFEGPALASFNMKTRSAKLNSDEGSDRIEDAVGRDIRRERTITRSGHILNPYTSSLRWTIVYKTEIKFVYLYLLCRTYN